MITMDFADIVSNKFVIFTTSILVVAIFWVLKKEMNLYYPLLRDKLFSFAKFLNKSKESKLLELITKEVNAAFNYNFKLLKITTKDPIVRVLGQYSNDKITNDNLKEFIKEINDGGFTNEPHLLVSNISSLDVYPIFIEGSHTDFATVLALRSIKQKPKVLGAGCILICSETGELVVHKRSSESATHPSHYHIFGGAYWPKINKKETNHDNSLIGNAFREVREETGLLLNPNNLPRFRTFSVEPQSGFIQYEYLGINIKKKELEIASENWEGDLVRIPFGKLEKMLMNLNWVPSGKAHILIWLALGAPNTNVLQSKKARNIYKRVLDQHNKINA